MSSRLVEREDEEEGDGRERRRNAFKHLSHMFFYLFSEV